MLLINTKPSKAQNNTQNSTNQTRIKAKQEKISNVEEEKSEDLQSQEQLIGNPNVTVLNKPEGRVILIDKRAL